MQAERGVCVVPGGSLKAPSRPLEPPLDPLEVLPMGRCLSFIPNVEEKVRIQGASPKPEKELLPKQGAENNQHTSPWCVGLERCDVAAYALAPPQFVGAPFLHSFSSRHAA